MTGISDGFIVSRHSCSTRQHGRTLERLNMDTVHFQAVLCAHKPSTVVDAPVLSSCDVDAARSGCTNTGRQDRPYVDRKTSCNKMTMKVLRNFYGQIAKVNFTPIIQHT